MKAESPAQPPPRAAKPGPTSRSMHRDHLLSCSATEIESGKFRANVAIIYMKGDKTRSQRFLDIEEVYASESEARDKGMACAIEWVDNNANVPESPLLTSRAPSTR
jgi:hypothetical protein